MLSTKLKAAAGNSADATLYVDDVFSTYLYTGTGATQTITNGIDLAGKGGLVWAKLRNAVNNHALIDTVRAIDKVLDTSSTSAESYNGSALTSFNNNGFTLDGTNATNGSGYTYASWTFRKAAKFFDVVTYTGDGVNGRAIPHNLGIAPGMIIVKSTSNSSAWVVYHRSLSVPTNKALYLNTTSAELTSPYFPTLPTSSVFYTNGDGYEVNTTGQTYVAYLYAHDTSSTGIIQCGSFATDGSSNATVNLGWEPQFALIKEINGADFWRMWDVMRGWPNNSTGPQSLFPNLSNAESAYGAIEPLNATGFGVTGYDTSKTFIYMAIRMPNKPPTSGTQVFSPLYSASPASTVQTTNFPVDMQIARYRSSGIGSFVMDRLRGVNSVVTTTVGTPYVKTNTAGSEVATTNLTNYWSNTGFSISGYLANAGSSYYNFKRAPGFFDEVCYTGSTSYRDLSHNLGAVPELVIIKTRSGGFDWTVGLQGITGTGKYLVLNSTAGVVSDINYFGSTWTSTKVLIDGNVNAINQNAYTYVMYLFATLAGISKVGSYTGNGTSQNIECGFAAGARFFLVKATSTTGSWWVWDSARGITSGNDPALQLNSTAAEITTADAVDPYSPGITVNQEATCSINASGVSYVYLAIS